MSHPTPATADRYPCFAALRQAHVEGRDYAITLLQRPSAVAVVAPHGGFVETATSAIAQAIAGDSLSLYCFDGLQPGDNQHLHITSTRFDEPRCRALVEASHTVLTVHGERSPQDVVFLGGLDEALGQALCRQLVAQDFAVASSGNPRLRGRHPHNICNLGRSGRGIQLELSRGLRQSLFVDHNSTAPLVATPRLARFAAAVRAALHSA